MDGASKFVRGDAIAGLLITFINIIAGMVIGMLQQGLSFQEAGNNYTLLTVGDGLVSQIPALIVSTAAGLLVSKAGVTGSADKALVAQFTGYPKALGMSAAVIGVLAFLPGMPILPFLGARRRRRLPRLPLDRQEGRRGCAEAAAAGAQPARPPPGTVRRSRRSPTASRSTNSSSNSATACCRWSRKTIPAPTG